MRGLSVRLLLALCLLSSTAQGFIAQTHVHARAGVAAATERVVAVDALAGDEPACVLCEIAGHTPAVAPPVHVLAQVLPRAVHATPAVASPSLLATVASHHWRGRAPPDRLIA